MSAELNIPEEAKRAACDAYEVAILRDNPEAVDYSDLSNHAEVIAATAAAPLVVAAELERLVDETDWAWAVGDSLKRRAAELRGDRKAVQQ